MQKRTINKNIKTIGKKRKARLKKPDLKTEKKIENKLIADLSNLELARQQLEIIEGQIRDEPEIGGEAIVYRNKKLKELKRIQLSANINEVLLRQIDEHKNSKFIRENPKIIRNNVRFINQRLKKIETTLNILKTQKTQKAIKIKRELASEYHMLLDELKNIKELSKIKKTKV